MLRNSFIFLEKVSKKREQNIWNQNIKNWNDFINQSKVLGISAKAKHYYNKKIKQAKQALLDDNSEFFANNLKSSEHWRTYNDFKDNAVFLDIETGRRGEVTVIGLYDNYETKTMIRGINLDKKTLEKELKKYKLLITFNGKTFDIPIIKKYFNISLDIPHIDLVHICRKLNLDGGLKNIEKILKIKRNKILKHVKGQDAAELWRCFHATGDKDFLDMLIAYNEEDCINLKRIADLTIKQLWNNQFL